MNNCQRCLCLLISTLLSTTALSGDAFDVDDADTLDFESFHKTKKDSIKIYDSQTGEILPSNKYNKTVKTYETETPTETAQQAAPASTATPTATTAVVKPKAEETDSSAGQKYEIRQRYAIGESENTSDTPYTAMNALYKKMAKYCPQGWVKEKEWSVPVEGDFYLHYEFSCQ